MTDATKPFEDAALAAFGDVLVVGVNHQTAGSRLRDQLFVPEEEAPRRLAELREMGLDEALLLSTCDRVEMVTTARDPAATRQALLALLARWGELRAADLAGQSYCRTGAAAVRHLFAVTASLDSQVIGEPQVLGQVKESHRRAVDAGMMGPGLEPVLRAAYQAAKRVRAETALAERPVTLAAAALRVARDLHGKLGRCAGLLVGLGEMGELLASELQAAGLNDLAIAHPRASRAEAVARRLACHLRPWEELPRALAAADVVVCAIGAGGYSITRDLAAVALKARRRKPIFFVDVSLPGDIEPAVQSLEGAFVYNLDDLERLAEEGKRARESVAAAAWQILDQELDAFRRDRAGREAVPAVVALRRQAEALREQVLADPKLDAAAATRLLLNRLLHTPSEVLRQAAAEGGPEECQSMERLVSRLFRLGPSVRPLSPEDRSPGRKGKEKP